LNTGSDFGTSTEDDRQVTTSHGLPESEPVQSFLELEQIRSRLLSLDPKDFEFIIRDVLQRTDFNNVSVTRYSQDGGLDLNAYPSNKLWPIGGMLVQVQAKR
jgi:hypothetical protein